MCSEKFLHTELVSGINMYMRDYTYSVIKWHSKITKKKTLTTNNSTVKLTYFISLNSIHAYLGGRGVVLTILMTFYMELCYSTKPIQGVAVSFCWTAKVRNRAITKGKKIQAMTDKANRKQRLKYININTMFNHSTVKR